MTLTTQDGISPILSWVILPKHSIGEVAARKPGKLVCLWVNLIIRPYLTFFFPWSPTHLHFHYLSFYTYPLLLNSGLVTIFGSSELFFTSLPLKTWFYLLGKWTESFIGLLFKCHIFHYLIIWEQNHTVIDPL